MATRADIEAAIAALRAADKPNISAVAREYNIERTRLSRLYNGRIGLKEDYDDNRGLLSKQQDLQLVELVNRLTRDGLPPTPRMVCQFCKDLCGKLPNKDWSHCWLARHKDDVDSGLLKGFDLDHKKADSFWQYRAYFKLVFAPSTHKTSLTLAVDRET
jgi:hypothetical protein